MHIQNSYKALSFLYFFFFRGAGVHILSHPISSRALKEAYENDHYAAGDLLFGLYPSFLLLPLYTSS